MRGCRRLFVYAEYLILENFIINYIILYVTKKFTRSETSIIRLITAALIGAVYTLVVFYPSLRFMTRFLVKFSISVLIIIVAFNPVKLNRFVKLITTFYVVSFIFAGAALALFYFTQTNTILERGVFYISDFPAKILALAVILSWILIKYTWGYIQIKINKSKIFIPITIKYNEQEISITALLDTGNSLKDPISESPVIIVQFSAIRELLPTEIQGIFTKYQENNLGMISKIMTKNCYNMKFRLIPYKSLGKENGMLLGFKPDKVLINEDDEQRVIKDIIVGIYNSKLSNDEKYMALLHPEVLD